MKTSSLVYVRDSELVAQSVKVSATEPCQVERHRFVPRHQPDIFIYTVLLVKFCYRNLSFSSPHSSTAYENVQKKEKSIISII